MDLGLRKKRALIGGSSRGIGFACAELLAREGVELVLIARDEKAVAESAEKLGRAWGVRAGHVAADLATVAGVESAFAHAQKFLGGVDILINNSGGPKPGSSDALNDSDWMNAVNLNLMNTVRLTRLAVPGMIDRGWGRIVNIMSISVRQPIDGLMLSNSIRLAVVGFAKTLASELGPHGITVNTIAPGYTGTDRLQDLVVTTASREGKSSEQVLQQWASDVPLRRIARPEEIASATVFLCSEAASYITGVTLAVDGGRSRFPL